MNRIFIEAKSKDTPESFFIKAILLQFFPDKEFVLSYMDGVGNLFNESNVNQMRQAEMSGETVLVLVDADNAASGYGYEVRKKLIGQGKSKHNVRFSEFIYPDNRSDGDVEMLMEGSARKDLHGKLFDCFGDYECCIGGAKDENGRMLYHTPNRKGKLHTYINAQKLPNSLRRRFGSGDWLFDDERFWDLNAQALVPLKDFFSISLI